MSFWWPIKNIPTIVELDSLLLVNNWYKFIIEGEIVDVSGNLSNAQVRNTDKEFTLKLVDKLPIINPTAKSYRFITKDHDLYRMNIIIHGSKFAASLSVKSKFLEKVNEDAGKPAITSHWGQRIPILNTCDRYKINNIINLCQNI